MYSNFDVENFPPEAVALLRLLGENTGSVSVEQMEHHLDLSERSLGRAIRRLVSYHLIQLDYNGAYQLTNRGRGIYQQIQADVPPAAAVIEPIPAPVPNVTAEIAPAVIAYVPLSPNPLPPTPPEAANIATAAINGSHSPTPSGIQAQTQPITRRLIFVVQPSTADHFAQPLTILIGVNAPLPAQPPLGSPLSIALQLSATGCTLSRSSLALDVPIDKAALPESFTATITAGAQAARIRADIYQIDDFGDATMLTATYFDLPLTGALVAPRAFGITLSLA